MAADRYVRSTDGSDSDNGTTWALAKATMAGVAAIDTTGDTLWLSQVHSETTAGNVSLGLAGTVAAPTRVLCGNDAAEPPTVLTTGAIIAVTGNFNTLTLSNSTNGVVYYNGVEFRAGASTDSGFITTAPAGHLFLGCENCTFYLVGTGSIGVVSLTGRRVELINPVFRFSDAGHTINCVNGNSVVIKGGSFHASTTSPTSVFNNTGVGFASVTGFDFSQLSGSVNLVAGANSARITFANCKLPASWSGALVASTLLLGGRVSMYNCDSADTNYRLWIEDAMGSIKSETTLARTGGASDGDTPLSWKMVTTANAKFQHPLDSDPIFIRNSTTGSAKTVTVEILHDSVTNLKDDEVWVEVNYLGTSGVPLGTYINDGKANILATAADQTGSSETWTTTGMSNPNKQKLSVTFTPQEKGWFQAVVRVGKASYTLYVDPLITVS